MNLSAELLQFLLSPCCGQPLQVASGTLACNGCGMRFPVEDGIPVLLKERGLLAEPRRSGGDE